MAEVRRVRPEEVHERLAQGAALLLVCAYDHEDKNRAFRLEGAITLQELEARCEGIDPAKCEIVFYCASPDDQDALELAREWQAKGFTKAQVMAGGVEAWKEAGFPMAQPAPRETADHSPEPAPIGPKPQVPSGQEPLPPRGGRAAAGDGTGAPGRTAEAGGTLEGAGAREGTAGGLKARDFMTSSPEVITADATVEEAARRMRDLDVGALPVADARRRFVGMITDRDITIRVTAEGRSPSQARVEDVMTRDLQCVDEEAGIEEVAKVMQDRGVRRVPIVRRATPGAGGGETSPGDIVGIISLDDLATDLRVADFVARTLAQASRR